MTIEYSNSSNRCINLFTVLTCHETVTQSQSLTTESLTQYFMNDLVSVKLCCVVQLVCCVDFMTVSLVVDFQWDFHFHVCPVFFGGQSNYILVGRPHFSKIGLKKKKSPPASLFKDQCYEKLIFFKRPNNYCTLISVAY